ncbi:hypothetical protein OO015_05995 [Thermomicrobium sp. 4228-Ro]|uniref:hypothetical protein n=1 Tax=Thermomicrobium sp. 4228-Ro TaxID=2993937 RepID=UPI00224980C8|nr:hypothetical protein [Thermomicrobium sp. 4228-Ro]MCX2727047.1 hypothetical protein [Thermomicrobium sp. 4228-Ro]
MRLFATPPEAHSTRPVAPHRETVAQRLARAATPADNRIRSLLESWFVRIPEPARTDIRSRFWERDPRLALAAFWELYLHELFRRHGYQLMLHPATGRRGPRPDFLVARANEVFYVEALIHAPPTEAWRAERRLYPILDVLHELRRPALTIRLVHVEYGIGTPPLRELRETLAAWLIGLDAQVPAPARFVWQRGGWTLAFEALADSEADTRPVLPSSPTDETRVPRGIVTKVQAKARRFRSLEHPLVLALSTAQSVEFRSLVDLLVELIPRLPDPVSALLVAPGLTPWTIGRTPLVLCSSPEREHHVPDRFLTLLEQAGARPHAAGLWVLETPSHLFGLPPDWPESPCDVETDRCVPAIRESASRYASRE